MRTVKICFTIVFSGIAAGCSIHPLPEDFAGVSTHDIVQKVRCEAREALAKHALNKGKQFDRSAIRAKALMNLYSGELKQKLSDFKKFQTDRIEKLTLLGDDQVQNVNSLTEREARIRIKREIEDIERKFPAEYKKALEEEENEKETPTMSCLQSKLAESNKYLYGNYNKETISTLDGAQHAINDFQICFAEIIKFSEKGSINRKNGEDNTAALKRVCKSADSMIPSTSAPCPRLKINELHSHAKLKDKDGKEKIKEIIRSEYFRDNISRAIGYDFKFTMTNKDEISADTTFSLPFSSGTFTLGGSVGEEKSQENERSFKMAEDIALLLMEEPDNFLCSDEVDRKYPIAGKIGLDEVVDTYYNLSNLGIFDRTSRSDEKTENATEPKSADKAGSSAGAKKADFTEKLTFTTDFNGSLSPTLALNAAPNTFRLTRASGKIGGSRKDIHIVTITLVELEKQQIPKDAVKDPTGKSPSNLTVLDNAPYSCTGNTCSIFSNSGVYQMPASPALSSGTLFCSADGCTSSEGGSAVDKALEVLERKRREDAIDDLRDDLDQLQTR
jgi:hypothetical protein